METAGGPREDGSISERLGSQRDAAGELVATKFAAPVSVPDFNELSESTDPLVLVLDDYHTVTDRAIHDSVLFLIDHMPQCLSLVISTRSDPPLPLGRLRASGEMIEIRAAELALTVDEAADLLSARFGVELDVDSMEELHQRAEGWPAGLQLAGISLQSEPSPRAFVDRFTGEDRNVAHYLTSEVLERLSDSRKHFLQFGHDPDRGNYPAGRRRRAR